MIRFTPRHLYFYIVATLICCITFLGISRVSSTSSLVPDTNVGFVDDMIGTAQEEIKLPSPASGDQYQKEEEITAALNKSDSEDEIDNVEKLTDEEIREQLEAIKLKQQDAKKKEAQDKLKNSGEDSAIGTKLDNPQRIRLDKSPPDKFPWVSYELDRVVPTAINSYSRENATLFTLCRNTELFEILDSIQQMETRFNFKHNYDWVFMNDEPFTDEFIELTSNMVSGRARYGLIPKDHWSYPDYIDQDKAKSIRESRKWSTITYGSSESYRHMCRYNSLFFYKHPIMEEYQYFWRVEPHVSYSCDILEDPFKTMKNQNLMYGFTISMQELPNTIETLWSTSKLYFDKEDIQSQLPNNNLIKFISNDDGETYNLCHFWSNFEIVNLDLYRSELYEGYVQHLDHAGGFFYERWGDAPIHSIAASLILPRDQIWLFQNISYSHTVAHTCPLNDNYIREAKCTCDPKRDWTMNSASSCNIKFLESSEQEKNVDFDKYYTEIQNKLIDDERMKSKQRQLRMETARRQAAARKARAQERKLAKEKKNAERRARLKQEKQNKQDQSQPQ